MSLLSSSQAGADELLEGLDPDQREVALALRGPVRVLAGAGTGKTRAITHRVAYGVASGVYNPAQVLAVTFTTRAAGEMRARLRGLGAGGVQARTFHSAALRQARYFWPRVYGGDLPVLIDSKLGLVGGAARRNRVPTEASALRDLASEIEWSKVSNVRPDDYAAVARARGREVNGLDPATVAHVFASYEELKREQGRMDMEDVLLCAAGLLAEDERVAAEVRRQYHHFVVDEFQDVSPIQSALLDLWLGERHEICVVGDPAQTIYSFAGASADHLNDFPRRHPGTTTVELGRNYRSTPQVVETANRLMAGASGGSVRLRAQCEPGPATTYSEHPDEVAEAEAVAARIKELVDGGTSAGGVAVLVRTNAQSEAYEEALAARALPYVVRGAERFFQRGEVRQALTLLRGAARAGAAGTLSGSVAETPAGSLAGGTDEAGGAEPAADAVEDRESLADQSRAVLGAMGWAPRAPTTRGAARDRWESMQALLDQATAYGAAEPRATLGDFVAELERRAADQHAPVADGVSVATLHAAKGLEWDAVFLCGVQEGTLPIAYAVDSPAAVEEERRLLYVGITRARRSLQISWSQARNPGGRASRRPSRFLDGLRPQVGSDAAGARRERSRRGRTPSVCRVCGATLGSTAERKVGRCEGCPSTYDEALFERLRAWRLARAADESVPAYVVFTDLTLQAIAELRPGSQRALASISGVGPKKLEQYGAEVIAVVAAEPAPGH